MTAQSNFWLMTWTPTAGSLLLERQEEGMLTRVLQLLLQPCSVPPVLDCGSLVLYLLHDEQHESDWRTREAVSRRILSRGSPKWALNRIGRESSRI